MKIFRSSKSLWFTLVLTLLVASRVESADPAAGDTTADRVLGQLDFDQNAPNSLDGGSFNVPDDVVIDTQASPHRLWLSDSANNRVLGWQNVDALKDGAHADVVVGQPNLFSNQVNAGGGPSASSLSGPHGLAVDSSHNLYVADTNNHRVLVFTDPFAVKAQTGQTGGFSAFMVFGQSGNFVSALCNFNRPGNFSPNAQSLCFPVGVKLDQSNNLWVSDSGNNRVLAFFVPLVTDAVADVVIGQRDFEETFGCNVRFPPAAASLCKPGLLAFDAAGNLFVADEGDSRVLEYLYRPAAALPGTSASRVFGQNSSFTTGSPSSARTGLNSPYGISFDNSGNLFIADQSNNRVFEFTPPFDASPVPIAVFGQRGDFASHACNQGSVSSSNASHATLCAPAGVASDTDGKLWISDQNNSRLLRFTPPFPTIPKANLVLGQANFVENQANSVDSIHYNNLPIGIALDLRAVPNRLYVADTDNNRVLGYRDAESFQNGARATWVFGQRGFTGSSPNQGGSISAVGLKAPSAVAVDPQGNLFVADTGNNRVLRFPRPSSTERQGEPANAVFGQGGSFKTGGCSLLCSPEGVAVDGFGNVYISDTQRHQVLEFDAGFGSDPKRNKLFGAPTAAIIFPAGLALDAGNRLFVANTGTSAVLEFDKPLGTNTQSPNKVYGKPTIGPSACVGALTDAKSLCKPGGVAVGADHIYIADTGNDRILGFPKGLSTADMVFGQGNQFIVGRSDQAPGPETLSHPFSVAVDDSGNLFATDSKNNRVLEYLQPDAKPVALSLSATTMSFGTVPVHTTSSVIDVKVTNSGIVPISIPAITITGPQAAEFVQTNNCVGTLKAKSSCTIAGKFKPSVKGAASATVTINNNGPNAPQLISMSGTGS